MLFLAFQIVQDNRVMTYFGAPKVRHLIHRIHSFSFLSGPGHHDSRLSTKEARNIWEMEVSNGIITPQLKVETQLNCTVSENNSAWRKRSADCTFFFYRLVFCSIWIDSLRRWTQSSELTLASPPTQSWSCCLAILASSCPQFPRILWSMAMPCGAAGRKCLCWASPTLWCRMTAKTPCLCSGDSCTR